MNSPRRKRWLIDFEVQYSLLRQIALHWSAFMLANAVAMFIWFRFFESPLGTWDETFTKFASSYFPMLIVSGALLPIFLLETIKLSNRFAGPIMRLKQTIAHAAAGEKVTPLHFRHGDFWTSLALISIKLSVVNRPIHDPNRVDLQKAKTQRSILRFERIPNLKVTDALRETSHANRNDQSNAMLSPESTSGCSPGRIRRLLADPHDPYPWIDGSEQHNLP
ncbi:MAG: hypothetical protein U0905_14870 [Pirellulales bacterium]